MRISSHNLDYLEHRVYLMQILGYEVVRPVYVDWFWRGYSIEMKPRTKNIPYDEYDPVNLSWQKEL
jgi:hypothetical protein